MKETNKAERLRRLSGMTAAFVAMLAVVPAFSVSHGHPLVGFVCIGAQIVLLAISVRFLVQSKQLRGSRKD